MPSTSTYTSIILIERAIPIVFLDRKVDGINADFVGVDNAKAGRMATNLLIENGHTKIGIVAGSFSLNTFANRLRGYKQAFEENGLYGIVLIG